MCLGEAAEEHLSGDSDKRGLKGPLLDAIQRQFVSPAAEARPKTGEQLEPSP